MPSPTSDQSEVYGLRGGVFHLRRSVPSFSSRRHSTRSVCRSRPPNCSARPVPPGQPGLATGVDEQLAVDPEADAVVGERQQVVVARGVALELRPPRRRRRRPGRGPGAPARSCACTALWIAEIGGRSSGAPKASCGSTRVATTRAGRAVPLPVGAGEAAGPALRVVQVLRPARAPALAGRRSACARCCPRAARSRGSRRGTARRRRC